MRVPREDRENEKRTIAERLADLDPGIEINDGPARYLSLQVGRRKPNNCIVIARNVDRVSFLIPEQEIRSFVEESGFSVQPKPSRTKAFRGSEYWVKGVTSAAIERHSELFRKLVLRSRQFVEDLHKGVTHG